MEWWFETGLLWALGIVTGYLIGQLIRLTGAAITYLHTMTEYYRVRTETTRMINRRVK